MDQSDSKRCTKCGETKPLPPDFTTIDRAPTGSHTGARHARNPPHRYKETHREAATNATFGSAKIGLLKNHTGRNGNCR